jgi:hypothetical protein
MGDMRNACRYNILIATLEGMRPLGRHMRTFDDNMKMNPKGRSYVHDAVSTWLRIWSIDGLL